MVKQAGKFKQSKKDHNKRRDSDLGGACVTQAIICTPEKQEFDGFSMPQIGLDIFEKIEFADTWRDQKTGNTGPAIGISQA